MTAPIAFLTIAHNLFLTKEERYMMKNPLSEVETVGICLPVWVNGPVTSEPAEEVFCKYKLRNFASPGIDAVHMNQDGFVLSLGGKSLWESILDVKDGGSGSIYLSHQSKLVNNEIEMLVIHYINIQDMTVLTKDRSGY
jgi:hypothetical protein